MRLVNFTEKLARQYAGWKYPKPYDVYNLPSWDEMELKKYKITTYQGRLGYYAFVEDDVLVGVVSFKEMDTCIYMGIGLSPNMCGKGLGYQVLSKALEEYDKNNIRTKPFYAEVRAWNHRSIKTCQKCGFKIVDRKMCRGKDGDFEGVCLQLN